MGDRDGSDEPADETPDESQSGDSTDEQPVPESTAADATRENDTADDTEGADDPPDDGNADGSSDDVDGGSTDDAGDESADENELGPHGGLGTRRRSPDELAGSGSSDGDAGNSDGGEEGDDGDSFGSVDGEKTNWTPPTSDDTFDDDRDREPGDDDPSEWWKDHRDDDVVDEEPTGPDGDTADAAGADETAESGDEEGDDGDLDPAARRDQMQKGEPTRQAPDGSDWPRSARHSNTPHGEQPEARAPEEAKRAKDTGKPAHAPKGGGGSATARPTTGYDQDVEPATAPDDEEMPLTEHVEEMALRLLAVTLVMFGVAGIVVFYAGDLVNFLWYSFLGDVAVCPGSQCGEAPRVLHPLAVPLAYLKASTLVGFIIALPVGVYQTYRFMRPGLYPRERRYYLASIPMSLVLAATGVGFAYFAVLPSMFAYFTDYSEQAAEIAFSLTETFNLMILMLGFFALIFQIPLLVMLAIMMGVTTRQWLADRRLYFWAGFAGVAFLFSPDPTGMAPLIVAVTMIALFEGTLTLLRWTGTGSPIPTAEEAAGGRPVAYLVAAIGAYIASAGPLPPGYYGALPTQVTDVFASSGGPVATPAIIAGALIGLFEVGAFLLRRYGRSKLALRAWLAADSARIPIYFGAAVVGYFGSPNPVLLTAARDLALAPTQAALVGAGLVGLYELFIVGLRLRERGDDDDAPEEPATKEV